MKKLFALLLALSVLLALTACGNVDTNGTQDGSEDQTGGSDFMPEPAKYERDEFWAALEEYMGTHKPEIKKQR